ncbi:MAG: LCP family protein [Heliobacteriaceae bacterium]|nr:LCP family protein [Heliobacteriaceae bacterium]MDD4586943.1 LCP family protein [Heliobacteriaceae bacterium]
MRNGLSKWVVGVLVLGGVITGWLISDYLIAPTKLNVLLIGTDSRQGEQTGRADAILVVHIDRSQSRLVLLSLPRDSRVELPGYGWHKINDATVLGGVPLLKTAVEKLLGVPVHNYICCDFEGFARFIDGLGGITIDVEKDMYHNDSPELAINLKKGRQRLTGNQALGYVRYRGDPLGDIARVDRQQKFLTALFTQGKKPASLVSLPVLATQLTDYVATDFTGSRLTVCLATLATMNQAQIRQETLPGMPAMIKGVSYWLLDQARIRSLVAENLR